ncbi:MAG: siphovirus ReqiPepy6 Gp37-like family protein [Clostridium sp.]
MDLEVYSRDMEFLGIVDNFEVLKWHRNYYAAGFFELTCSLTLENLELLKKDNVIYKSDGEAAFIHYRNIKLNSKGEETLYIKGSFLTAILKRRIIWEQLCFSGKVEELYRKIINENCINPSNVDRKIPLLKLGELKNYTDDIAYQNSYGNVLEQLGKLSETYGIGYRISLNYTDLTLEFEVYKGLDRTDGQNINDKAIFSREYENVLEQDYVESIGDYKNTCLIAGEGEGLERKITCIENGTGLDRYEMYVDARDIQNTKYEDDVETTIPDSEYLPMLIQRGEEKLDNHKSIETFDSIINVNQDNLVYKKDYDLGDIVTIFDNKWGITLDTRITEVEEIYQGSKVDINIIFGNDMPTIYNKLKGM